MNIFWLLPFQELALILGVMFLLWLLSLVLRDVSIVDPFWGTGFVLLAWSTYLRQDSDGIPRGLLLCSLVTLWGLRLSMYLLWRNHGKGEDRRYTAMREHAGQRFWWLSLFSVFGLQGLLLWLIALPVLMTVTTPQQPAWNVWDLAGVSLWLIGLAFESIGDWQLARFKASPDSQGKVLRQGLWRYTRHPNYFGDFCVWWGLYCLAVGAGAWWTIFSPLIMSILLMRISGVTLLESTIEDRRPEYAEYRRTTNAFFPGFPRS